MNTGLRNINPEGGSLGLASRALIVLTILSSLALCSVFRDELQRWLLTVGQAPQKFSAQHVEASLTGPFEVAGADRTMVVRAELDVTFTPEATPEFQNLFQTADGNAGIRAELSGETLSVVYRPLDHSHKAIVGARVSTSIEPGVQHLLKIWILDGQNVIVQLDGEHRRYLTAVAPSIDFSRVLVGGGFDATRTFYGTIDQFDLTLQPGRPAMLGVLGYFLIRCLIVAGFVVAAWLLFADSVIGRLHSKTHNAQVPSSRNDPLLGLRGLAFLCVFFGHFFMVVFVPADLLSLIDRGSLVWLLTASPWGGVWIFFTLSGYLMGKGFVTQRYVPGHTGLTRFYRNRALRILPMYFVATLLIGVLVHPEIFTPSEPGAVDDVLSVLFFDNQNALPIGALWSVSTEAQFYLMVPFLYLALRPLVKSARGLISVALVIISSSIFINTTVFRTFGMAGWHAIYFPLAANLPIFLIGVLMAFVTQSIRARSLRIRRGVLLGSLLAGTMYLGLAWWSAHSMLTSNLANKMVFLSWAPIITAIVTAAIIFIFECSDHAAGRVGSGRRLLWGLSSQLGLLTYALYVWHEPILLWLRGLAAATLSLGSCAYYLLYAIPALLCVAGFFYRLIELPFDRMKHSSAPARST